MSDPKYLDYGTPISFGGIDPEVIPSKTVTRRRWSYVHAAKYLKAYDRAQASQATLRIPAIDKGFYAKGKQIGWLMIKERPYRERLCNMPHSDLLAEGGMCESVAAFASRFFKGDLDLGVWVVRYQFVPLEAT